MVSAGRQRRRHHLQYFLTSHYFDIFKSLLLWKRWTSLIFASQDTILENFGHCFWWRIWVSITALSVFWKIYRHPILLSSWNDNSNSLWSQWELVSVKIIHRRFFLFFPPLHCRRKMVLGSPWAETIQSNPMRLMYCTQCLITKYFLNHDVPNPYCHQIHNFYRFHIFHWSTHCPPASLPLFTKVFTWQDINLIDRPSAAAWCFFCAAQWQPWQPCLWHSALLKDPAYLGDWKARRIFEKLPARRLSPDWAARAGPHILQSARSTQRSARRT